MGPDGGPSQVAIQDRSQECSWWGEGAEHRGDMTIRFNQELSWPEETRVWDISGPQ
jgi:hypothetical protein